MVYFDQILHTYLTTGMCNIPLSIHSDRAIESYQKLPNMTPEQVAESEIPLMFVSFPSAKDPHWEEKHPGRELFSLWYD